MMFYSFFSKAISIKEVMAIKNLDLVREEFFKIFNTFDEP